MKTIAISTPKGGVGKTTLASTLAHLFSQDYQTLIIDIDPQGNLTNLLKVNNLNNSNINKLFIEKNPRLKPLTLKNFDLLGANIDLTGSENKQSFEHFIKLKNYLQSLRNYDYCIIDCPANLGSLTINAMLAADYLLCPIDSSGYALTGADILIKEYESIKTGNPNLKLLGVVLNNFKMHLPADQKAASKAQENFADLILGEVIPSTTEITKAEQLGVAVTEANPQHKVSLSLKKLYQQIISKIED